MRRRSPVTLRASPLALALALACNNGAGMSTTTTDSATGDALTVGSGESDGSSGSDSEQEPPATGFPGTTLRFDLSVDWDAPSDFYAFPFPADLRLDGSDRPRFAGFPAPPSNFIVNNLMLIAADRDRWPANPIIYLPFDGPIATIEADTLYPPTPGAALMLMDLGPSSAPVSAPQLLPILARNGEADPYLPTDVLTVTPLPGVVLAADHRFACVALREFGDASGGLLGQGDATAQLLRGQTPSDDVGGAGAGLVDDYAALGEALTLLGVGLDEVAGATVFTVGDTVADTFAITEEVRQRYAPTLEGLAPDPEDGLDHPRFCELHGTIRLPQFQAGEPPFNEEGQFAYADGELAQQREDVVPVALTIPRAPMPEAGYPLVIYAHGSNGLSTQVVDRGPTLEPGGSQTPGEGPAHVLAAHGFAAVGFAALLNPERLPGGPDRAYLNLANLSAYRDTFVQAAIDERLLIDALASLALDEDALAGCDGATLPDGASAYRLATERVYLMGQSAGSHVATMVGALDPRVAALAPTGSGGYWSLLMSTGTELTPSPGVIQMLLSTDVEVSIFHPGMQLLEYAWEAAEPLVYAPRIAAAPLSGHPARSIYTPVGQADPFFPEAVFDAMSLAYGLQQAGEELWPELQATLDAGGHGGLVDYPASHNRASTAGDPYTGVVAQYAEDGIIDSHSVFAQLDEVKHQYGCLFASYERDGVAVVPAPASTDTPCP